MHYSSYARDFPLFLRAAQHKHFANLAIVTGIGDAEVLRTKVKEGYGRLSDTFRYRFDRNPWNAMNMDKLDSIV